MVGNTTFMAGILYFLGKVYKQIIYMTLPLASLLRKVFGVAVATLHNLSRGNL